MAVTRRQCKTGAVVNGDDLGERNAMNSGESWTGVSEVQEVGR